MGKAFFSAVVSIFLIAACSSGSGAGNPGSTQSGGSTCDAVCQKGVSLKCGSTTSVSECTNKCSTELAGDQCASLSLGLTICALDNFGCDILEGQLDAAALLQVCASQSGAYLGCQACEPEADDSTCEACKKSSCCSERKALYQNPDMGKFTACASECTDAACQEACTQQYPSLVQLTQAEQACGTSKCESACSATGG